VLMVWAMHLKGHQQGMWERGLPGDAMDMQIESGLVRSASVTHTLILVAVAPILLAYTQSSLRGSLSFPSYIPVCVTAKQPIE